MIAALLSFLSCLLYAQTPDNIGIVFYVEGVADISRAGEEKVLLKENDIVNLKDRIRTKSYSKVEVTFRDNSVVKIAPSSCIQIDEYSLDKNNKRESAKIMLSRGKLEAVVSKTSKPETFIINTPNAKGTVKGSDIFVFYQGGNTGVLVKEGLMAISSQSLPETKIDVSKGDTSLVSFNEAPQASRPYLDADMARHKKDVEPALTKKWVSFKGVTQMTAAITIVTGNVRIYKKGASDWRQIKLNEVVYEGDKLQTGETGWTEIRLSNGNSILLHNNTELVFAKLEYDPKTGEFNNSFESSAGKIKAVIAKLGKNSTFEVKTPTAVCGARGTVMYLDIAKDVTQAFYEGGAGFMTSTITNMTQNVDAGQNSASNAAGNISAPAFTPAEQKLSDSVTIFSNTMITTGAPFSVTAIVSGNYTGGPGGGGTIQGQTNVIAPAPLGDFTGSKGSGTWT